MPCTNHGESPPARTGARSPTLGMILKGYPRISETFISNEIRLLERSGYRVHIFSMRRPREAFAHRSVAAIRARVDYLPETLWQSLPRLLAPNLDLLIRRPGPYLQALAVAWRRFRRTRRIATLKHLLQAGYLVRRLLPASGVVHLHAHFAHSPTSVAMFAAQLAGLPYSFTAHAKDIYTSDPRQLTEKIRMARFVVTCTEYNRSYLQRLAGGQGAPIHRIYHGIDVRLFAPESFRWTPQPPYRLLTVARLTAKKGLPTVYRALRHLADAGIDFTHTLIGDGEDRSTVQDLIRRFRLESRTEWIGAQPHEVVLAHYRKSDLFVIGCQIAANGDRDGLPNVLMESMAMGVPVVATRVSALPEIVFEGRTGLLVPPGDDRRMAAAMRRLLQDADLRRTTIEAGRELVRSRFDNARLVEDLVQIYRHRVPGLRPSDDVR